MKDIYIIYAYNLNMLLKVKRNVDFFISSKCYLHLEFHRLSLYHSSLSSKKIQTASS